MKPVRCLVIAAVLMLSMTAWPSVPGRGQPPLIISFLDVGPADCAVATTPLGQTLLVDGGDEDSASAVCEFLRAKGIHRLDLVIATHPHAEHIGGLPQILSEFEVGLVYDSGKVLAGAIYDRYASAVDSRGVAPLLARPGRAWRSEDGVVVTFLWPPEPLPATLDDSSVVFRLSYGGFSALFTGDISTVVEEQLIRREGAGLRSDVLKVTDHGSLRGSSMAFLQAVAPSVAVIPVGKNVYGHPSANVVERLGQVGARVYRTDRDGNVSISTGGSGFFVTTSRSTR